MVMLGISSPSRSLDYCRGEEDEEEVRPHHHQRRFHGEENEKDLPPAKKARAAAAKEKKKGGDEHQTNVKKASEVVLSEETLNIRDKEQEDKRRFKGLQSYPPEDYSKRDHKLEMEMSMHMYPEGVEVFTTEFEKLDEDVKLMCDISLRQFESYNEGQVYHLVNVLELKRSQGHGYHYTITFQARKDPQDQSSVQNFVSRIYKGWGLGYRVYLCYFEGGRSQALKKYRLQREKLAESTFTS